MRLPLDNIPQVIGSYIEEELLPKGSPVQQFTTVFFGMGFAKQAKRIIDDNADKYRMIGVLDDDGINIEEVRDLALEAFVKSGPITIAGVILDKNDVNVLYKIAKKHSKE